MYLLIPEEHVLGELPPWSEFQGSPAPPFWKCCWLRGLRARGGMEEVMQHRAASSEGVRDDTAGSDLGFLPLNLQGWAQLGWAGLGCWAAGCS